MKIAHLADLHLGYRAYHRVLPGGTNAREADVAGAFARAIERLVSLRPDLVLIAGDVFHSVRPSNSAIADAFRKFSSLAARLPGVPLVMIAGNHDSPRSAETGNILTLFSEIPNLVVVTDEALAVHLPELDTTVLCLPHNALAAANRVSEDAVPRGAAPDAAVSGSSLAAPGGAEDGEWRDTAAADAAPRSATGDGLDIVAANTNPADSEPGDATAAALRLEPDPDARYNVLMLHGTISGSSAEGKIRYVSEFGGVTVEDSAIAPERWDYVALGHYHIATELAPNMWYAGGIERTSTNIWEESGGAKGFIVFDTDRRSISFHALDTRPVIDLPRLNARGLAAEAVDDAIAGAVAAVEGGIEGKILRLVIEDIPRHVVRELDHRRIREFKASALHFQLDPRPPQRHRVTGFGAPMRRRTLDEQVESFLRKHWQPSTEQIDRDRLVGLGQRYLAAAGEEA